MGVCVLGKSLAWTAVCAAIAVSLGGCRDPGPGAAPASLAPDANSGPGNATLSWEAPTSNTNDTPLTDLAGYRIYYGPSPEHFSHTVEINNIGLQTYVIDDLEPGTWYFAVRAVAANGSESKLSEIVAKTLAGNYRAPHPGG